MTKHLLKPIRVNKLGLLVVEQDQGPQKLGKFPDFITKGLKGPGGGKIRAAVQGAQIAYKVGPRAWKAYIRWYTFKYKKYLLGGGVLGGISTSFINSPGKFGETRNYLVQPSRRRRNNYNNKPVHRCRTQCC